MYRNKVKERNELEKELLSPVYPSDLKMVKVKKSKRGRKTPSLVFRISRSHPVVSDDSGIKCSSPSEDETSIIQEKEQELARTPLKIKIPKSVLLVPHNNESGLSGDTSVDLTLQNINKNCDILNDSTDVMNDKNSPVEAVYPLDASVDSTLQNINENYDILNDSTDVKNDKNSSVESDYMPSTSVESTLQNLYENFDLLNESIDVKNDKTNIVEADNPSPIESTPVKLKSYDLRSSARVLLRVQQESKQHFSPKTPSSVVSNPSFLSSINKSYAVPASPIRRRRVKRTEIRSKTADCKIKKYGRRGRPPKKLLTSDLSIAKPIIVGNIKNENEIVLQPLKNTVWTLVPKELFQSDFFKSQVIKVRSPNVLNRKIPDASFSFSPIATSRPITPQNNGQIRFKVPKYVASPRTVIQHRPPEDKKCKRPTVIYFKNERKCNVNECPPDHQTLANDQPQTNNEHVKNRNDLPYLLNKYCTLEDIVVTTIYELTTYDVNKTDAILSDLVLNKCVISPEEKIFEEQTNLTNDMAEIHLNDEPLLSSEYSDRLNTETLYDTIDILSFKIIAESMRILYSEEAVLQ